MSYHILSGFLDGPHGVPPAPKQHHNVVCVKPRAGDAWRYVCACMYVYSYVCMCVCVFMCVCVTLARALRLGNDANLVSVNGVLQSGSRGEGCAGRRPVLTARRMSGSRDLTERGVERTMLSRKDNG